MVDKQAQLQNDQVQLTADVLSAVIRRPELLGEFKNAVKEDAAHDEKLRRKYNGTAVDDYLNPEPSSATMAKYSDDPKNPKVTMSYMNRMAQAFDEKIQPEDKRKWSELSDKRGRAKDAITEVAHGVLREHEPLMPGNSSGRARAVSLDVLEKVLHNVEQEVEKSVKNAAYEQLPPGLDRAKAQADAGTGSVKLDKVSGAGNLPHGKRGTNEQGRI